MKPISLHKNNLTFVKCALCFVLMGLAIRLWFSDSIGFSSVVDSVETPPGAKTESLAPEEQKTESLAPEEQKTESLEDSLPFQTPVSVYFPGNDNQTSKNGEPFFFHFLFLSFFKSCMNEKIQIDFLFLFFPFIYPLRSFVEQCKII